MVAHALDKAAKVLQAVDGESELAWVAVPRL